jgi:hypothetical protein
MERTKWTDEMLDQRFAAMDEKSELLFSELRLLREEMRAGFADLRVEMAGLRTELVTQMEIGRAQVLGLHRQRNTALLAALVAVIGLLGVLVAKL